MTASASLVSVDDLTYRYARAGEPALRGVSLTAEPGEVLLVAGPSGCGKSTLMRAVNGLVPHRYRGALTGSVTVAGHEVARTPMRELSRLVGSVLQNPMRQIVGTTVESELAFGPENLGVPRAEIRERIAETARRCEITALLDRSTAALSGGQQQMLAIASVLVMDPKVVVVDEPLANLDPVAAARALRLLRSLADEGRAVIVVEHRVEEVLDTDPDRVCYLDDGQVAYLGDVAGFLAVADPRQVKLPVEAALDYYGKAGLIPDAGRRPTPATAQAPAPAATQPEGSPPLLEYRGVDAGYDGQAVLHDVNASFARHRKVAVLGTNGSGKTTLLKTAMRLVQTLSGEIKVDGAPITRFTTAALARSFGYVFQNPSQMFFARTIAEELLFGGRNLGLPEQDAAALAERSLARVNLPDLNELRDRPAMTLSFGQQKRLALAVALSLRPHTLILDEPTAGQDYGNTIGFMREVSAIPGLETLFFITHDVDLALSFADHVVVVGQGRVLVDGPPRELVGAADRWPALGLRRTSLLEVNRGREQVVGLEALAAERLRCRSPQAQADDPDRTRPVPSPTVVEDPS